MAVIIAYRLIRSILIYSQLGSHDLVYHNPRDSSTLLPTLALVSSLWRPCLSEDEINGCVQSFLQK